MAVPSKMTLLVTVIAAFVAAVISIQETVKIPKTGFNCEGRPSGYYADLETGCQVYHMCDGLGRQFSYSCPNTTLFQQRMLICDHWYMVNCSVSEKDYSANLLIGQRDKPFVSDSEDHQRTPRPDILSAPYAQGFNNYGGFQELNPIAGEKSIFDDSIANGHNDINDGVRRFPLPTHWSTELTNFNRFTTASPLSAVSKGFTGRPIIIEDNVDTNANGLLSQSTENSKVISNFPIFERDQSRQTTNFLDNNQKTAVKQPTTQNQNSFDRQNKVNSFNNNAGANLPSKFLDPPLFAFDSSREKASTFKSTTVKSIASFNNDFLSDFLPPLSSESSEEGSLRNDLKNNEDAVINFIKRFNTEVTPNREQDNQPNAFQFTSGGSLSGPFDNGFEIQTSSETAGFATQQSSNNQISRTPQKSAQTVPSPKPPAQTVFTPQAKILNTPQQDRQNENSNKIESSLSTFNSNINSNVPTLSPDLLPPFENEYLDAASTTMGPIIYYEWKEAAPVMDLQPPLPDNENNKDNIQKRGEQNTKVEGKPDFAKPRPTTIKPVNQVTERSTPDQTTSEGNTDFKVSSYFVPDYVFPLDKEHPGYEEDDALTSFQVKIPHTIDNNEAHPYYGENAQCPQCHPSFVVPGTCKPCVMIRR